MQAELALVLIRLAHHGVGFIMLGAIGGAVLVAHRIGALEHLGPLLLQLLARGDVWQRPARAQDGADKGSVGTAKGKP
ncbi:hypothetical protein D3C80_1032750 [compost metagenome]